MFDEPNDNQCHVIVTASSSWLAKKMSGIVEIKNAVFTAVLVCIKNVVD